MYAYWIVGSTTANDFLGQSDGGDEVSRDLKPSVHFVNTINLPPPVEQCIPVELLQIGLGEPTVR